LSTKTYFALPVLVLPNLGSIGIKEIFVDPFSLDKKEKDPLAFATTGSGGLGQILDG
jgi:hypothetical protein